MMSCKMSCDKGMTSHQRSWNNASNGENVMWRRLSSYYYINMIQKGTVRPIFDRFIYLELKKDESRR